MGNLNSKGLNKGAGKPAPKSTKKAAAKEE